MPNVAIVVVNHTISVRILFTLACGMWMFVFQKKKKEKKRLICGHSFCSVLFPYTIEETKKLNRRVVGIMILDSLEVRSLLGSTAV